MFNDLMTDDNDVYEVNDYNVLLLLLGKLSTYEVLSINF